MACSSCSLCSDSLGFFSAAGAEREAECHRESSGREGGLLTGPLAQLSHRFPFPDGTNKPTSPVLQFPSHRPTAARSHTRGGLGSGRVQQSHQEGCEPRGSRCRALRALK